MRESVAIAKDADTKKDFSPTRSDNSIHRVRDEHEMQLGSIGGVIGNIRRDGGKPSVESIATELGSRSAAERTPALLALQQTHGNQYVQRVFSGIHAKLMVGQPGDIYEQEADRVADAVMRMPEPGVPRQVEEEEEKEGLMQIPLAEQISPLVQRQVELEKEEKEEEEILQSKEVSSQMPEVTPDFESRIQSLKSSGQPLPEADRSFMERRFGVDFSGVRVHTDSDAVQMSKALNAEAFTIGNNIVFASGQYSSQSKEGKRLIAHELVHVIQQKHHRIQTIMRTCNCNSFGHGRMPTRAEAHIFSLPREIPNLRDGDYCITEEANSAYNCYALSIGIENRVLGDDEIDSEYGDGNGVLTYSDLNRFYYAHGLIRTENRNYAEIWVYGNRWPLHAAKITRGSCNGSPMYESKLGAGLRIAHLPEQLEGGAYGNFARAYARFPVRRSRYPSRVPYHQLPSKTQPI